jgi:hypothetical protein
MFGSCITIKYDELNDMPELFKRFIEIDLPELIYKEHVILEK